MASCKLGDLVGLPLVPVEGYRERNARAYEALTSVRAVNFLGGGGVIAGRVAGDAVFGFSYESDFTSVVDKANCTATIQYEREIAAAYATTYGERAMASFEAKIDLKTGEIEWRYQY